MAIFPALFLYALWRYHVAHAGVEELKPLPIAEWNWPRLPETAASALDVSVGKAALFRLRRHRHAGPADAVMAAGLDGHDSLLTFNAALFVLYNSFILVTYIAAFPAEMSIEAHSYFRYNTHLSLVLVLSLALAVRDLGAGGRLGVAACRPPVRLIGSCPCGAGRFCKTAALRSRHAAAIGMGPGKEAGPICSDGDRLALLLPGDNDSVATMISGVLAETPPRRRMLDLLCRNTADPATLDEAARLGYPLALISCTPKGWEDLPAGEAALLRQDPDGWHLGRGWPYPADAAKQRWQHILSWGPLCRSQ